MRAACPAGPAGPAWPRCYLARPCRRGLGMDDPTGYACHSPIFASSSAPPHLFAFFSGPRRETRLSVDLLSAPIASVHLFVVVANIIRRSTLRHAYVAMSESKRLLPTDNVSIRLLYRRSGKANEAVRPNELANGSSSQSRFTVASAVAMRLLHRP